MKTIGKLNLCVAFRRFGKLQFGEKTSKQVRKLVRKKNEIGKVFEWMQI
jgi:hypothetical protein